MHSPSHAGRIIGECKEESIGLPYSHNGYTEGDIIQLGKSYAADLFIDGDIAIWDGSKGQIKITKVGANWVEGAFYFTGTVSDQPGKTLPVTDGFFRIPIKK